ncbi:hypothetical protein [Paraburkholderia caribensis]|uniref:hypothetical protein n=1 Tax=Paraburkholderia caribensis TaxID=75105 RepID=UPI001D084F64|nr:hypothetical protein [Paraburkholderia caribensis]
MKRTIFVFLLAASSLAFGATFAPVQLLDPYGSTAGQAIVSTGPSTAPVWATVGVANVSGAAPLASPTFTGTPAAPTATAGTSTTQLATTAFVTTAVANQASIAGQPAFQAYRSASQTLTIGTAVKVQFNTENYDTNSAYDNTTNFRFTPQKAGKYRVRAQVSISDTLSGATSYQNYAQIYKNGSVYASTRIDGYGSGAGTAAVTVPIDMDIQMNGTTDYLEIFSNVTSAASAVVNGGTAPIASFFEAAYIGP